MKDDTGNSATPKRVLWSVTPEQTPSTYVHSLASGIREHGVEVTPLSLRAVCLSSGQIVHIQWPEHVSRGGGRVKTLLKHARAGFLLAAFRLRKHHLVITVHNRRPHYGSSWFDDFFRSSVYRMADAVIGLVPAHLDILAADGTLPPGTRREVIPHPIVRSISAVQADRPQSGPLVILGQIHPYHLIEPFLDALEGARSQRKVLVIGWVGDEELLARLTQRADVSENLEIVAGFMPENELDEVLRDAAAVVALQRNNFNSGAPFDALPRGIPIILSSGPQADELAAGVGHNWVYPVSDPPTQEEMSGLDQWLAKTDRGRRELEHLDPRRVAETHLALYRSL